MNTKYPASNYKEIRLSLKVEMKLLTSTHIKNKRENLSTWKSYQEFRVKHIAYSMFKGSTFEQIESKWKDPLNPMHNYFKTKALALYDSYMKRIVLSIVAEDAIEVTVEA